MAKLQVTGRVIALSAVQEIPSTTAGNPPMKKRELYLDMTMYDPYTGECSEKENKPLLECGVLEFGGDKVLDKIAALNLQKDDVVTVSFVIQGIPYKDKQTGKSRVYTAIRYYDIEVVRKVGQQAAQTAQPAPEPQGKRGYDPAAMPPTNQPAPQNDGNKEEPLPF